MLTAVEDKLNLAILTHDGCKKYQLSTRGLKLSDTKRFLTNYTTVARNFSDTK